MATKFQARFLGSEEWISVAGDTARECAERTIFLHGLRWPRRIREVAPDTWRGLIGRRVSPTVSVRPAR